MPVKLNKSYVPAANVSIDIERKTGSMPDHFAAYVEFHDGSSTILPIALHLLRVLSHSKKRHPGCLRRAKRCFLRTKTRGQSYKKKFQGMPLLNMCDAVLMVPTVTNKSKEKL
jgi:hypothetical protein